MVFLVFRLAFHVEKLQLSSPTVHISSGKNHLEVPKSLHYSQLSFSLTRRSHTDAPTYFHMGGSKKSRTSSRGSSQGRVTRVIPAKRSTERAANFKSLLSPSMART